MNNIMIISSFITCLISSIVSFDFMDKMFSKTYTTSYIPFMIMMTFFMFIINIFENTYLNYLGTIIYFFILSHVLYFCEENSKKIYFITFLFVLFLIGIEIITTILIQTVFMKDGIKEYQYLVASIDSTIVTLLMYRLLIRVLKKEQIKSQKLSIEFFLLILSFFVIMSYFEILYYDISNLDVLFIVTMCIILIVANIFSMHFFDQIRNDSLDRTEKQMIMANNKLIHDIYDIQLENYQQNKKLLHDIKAHLYVSSKLSDSEQKINYNDELTRWIEDQKIYINDTVIQILLLDFVKKCKEMQIKLFINIKRDVIFNSISDFDKVTIFSNIFNNAYNEVVKLETNNKTINLVIKPYQKSIIIDLKNTLGEQSPRIDINNKTSIGTGLKNVKTTVESLNGSVLISTDNNIFDITIIIPLGE